MDPLHRCSELSNSHPTSPPFHCVQAILPLIVLDNSIILFRIRNLYLGLCRNRHDTTCHFNAFRHELTSGFPAINLDTLLPLAFRIVWILAVPSLLSVCSSWSVHWHTCRKKLTPYRGRRPESTNLFNHTPLGGIPVK